MPATFIRELLALPVRDSRGDLLGHIGDLTFDDDSGDVRTLLVTLQPDLDPGRLPWPAEDGLLLIPIEEIVSVGADVRLAR